MDDEPIASSSNMFVSMTIRTKMAGRIVLSIRFKSLSKALERSCGRARWRTRLVTSNGIRSYRQTLLGHMPGWCPAIHAVGPYRPIEHLRGAGMLQRCSLSAAMRDGDGVLSVKLVFLEAVHPQMQLTVRLDHHVTMLRCLDSQTFAGEVIIAEPELWWPHTHGEPKLYGVFLSDGATELHLGNTGFRHLRLVGGEDDGGFQLEINGTPVFCRGACWTSADLVGLRSDRDTYMPWLRLARDAGMNMIRIGGTMLYESRSLHDLCDELGILVWQDLMFANLDYPMEDAAFQQSVVLEIEQLVERLAASPSFVVLCGGSEMAQQATMLGLPADRRALPFLEVVLPEFVAGLKPDLVYVPNSPWGGPLPINVNVGVAHYYGIGAYERPLEDARRAGVRFAAECLAFANPPHPASVTPNAGVDGPRDPGTSWTFADTRDFYLRLLYLVDPSRLRAEDPHRYLDLSRAVTADLMEAVFAEWRRPASSCAGGLVWQLQDLAPGSGWGVIDSSGCPKAAWHGLCRVLAPIQVLISDEGVNGLEVHVLNETARPLSATIQLRCLGHASMPILAADRTIIVPARGSLSLSSHVLCDGFFDITRTYRFGPAEHLVTVATLRCDISGRLMSQAFHFPVGRALPPDDLGLVADLVCRENSWLLEVTTKRFAQAVHFEIDGYRPDLDWFHLPPSETRCIALSPLMKSGHPPRGRVHALNGRTPVPMRARP